MLLDYTMRSRPELPTARALPSIRTPQQAHGITDGTVQKALRILKDEGLVHTVRGRGVFVTPRDSRDR